MGKHPKLTIYFSATPGLNQWKPQLDFNWGESTHFVHPTAEEIKDLKSSEGIPLNKDYSLGFMWLWFYATISLEFPTKQCLELWSEEEGEPND